MDFDESPRWWYDDDNDVYDPQDEDNIDCSIFMFIEIKSNCQLFLYCVV